MAKYEVGKAILVDDSNRHLVEPSHEWFGNVIAYCKGKNGHYFVVEGRWSRREIIRLQRITQLRISDYVASKSLDDDDTMLSVFEEAVLQHTPYRRKVVKKDMQRHPCYRWEADFGNTLYKNGVNPSKTMTNVEALKVTHEICREYGIPLPKVTFNKSGSCSYARGSREIKYLLDSDSNVAGGFFTVLHETAHIIDSARGRTSKDTGHGPKFIGIYIDLLNSYANIDIKFLEEKAKAHKLKIEY